MKNILNTAALLAIIALLVPVSVWAGGGTEQPQTSGSDTRIVTDQVGHTVEIPVNPQRIGTLRDAITLALIELNANVVGTHTKTSNLNQKPYIWGAKEQLNLSLEDTGFIHYGNNDIERIKLSQPDLIIGSNYHGKLYQTVSGIAPTVLGDVSTGREQHRYFAIWSGTEDRFNELNAQYKKRVQEVRGKFSKPPENYTIERISFRPQKDELRIFYNSAVREVLQDIGFQKTNFTKKYYKEHLMADTFSMEVLPDIFEQADFLLISYLGSDGDRKEDREKMTDEYISKSYPSWKSNTKAYKSDTLIFVSSSNVYSGTFAAYNYVLDLIEQHAK